MKLILHHAPNQEVDRLRLTASHSLGSITLSCGPYLYSRAHPSKTSGSSSGLHAAKL